MIKTFKMNIKGGEWVVNLLRAKQYNKKHGDDSDACVYTSRKLMCFNVDKISPGIIRHELLHAIVEESHGESANLAEDQVEEVCASIVQTQWNNINLWTEYILNKVTEQEVKDGE